MSAAPTRRRSRRLVAAAATLVAAGAIAAAGAGPAHAASSKGCVGGGYSVVLPGSTIAGEKVERSIPAAQVGSSLLIRGRYNEFTIPTASFGITNYTFTGAPNELDMTGGKRLVTWESKLPDLRGATLTSAVSVTLDKDAIEISRSGTGVSMKIQAKDCAQGGIFQMEPQRSDGTATVITHRLPAGVFYYDNPNFRARIGQTTALGIVVAARVNIGTDAAARFVARDSAQVATRLADCQNVFGTHCGGVSRWSVASGGRMGYVTGEDSVENGPPPTTCTQNCQAQNQVRGKYTVLGFPFPVPAASRLTPREPGL